MENLLNKQQQPEIDLNCDLGEGYPHDPALMPYISSANIACTFHAGDYDTMVQTVRLAKQHNVAVGAHPGFADKENFGRRELPLSPEQVYDLVSEQLRLIGQVCKEEDIVLQHVKPHGALYNMAARDAPIAAAVADAVFNHDKDLVLYGLSGSQLIKEAKKKGLKTASEVFADRTYQDDGTLTPRSAANALIQDTATSIKQVLQVVQQRKVQSVNEVAVEVAADTICIHGDGEHAVEFAKAIHAALLNETILIQPPAVK
ncbi:5-oxoprolinase subunit PxpA [Aridibaculum aurantiacum]|uniref:5-oxoprolinase subunit PxpA n=1 Tax=Aridibaculum aurantiacum TaxID=2810307 RepID=UPI001A95B6F3|nr:5-oxoprolinase subunit PxpA [Aridibaculum aurantiacum]